MLKQSLLALLLVAGVWSVETQANEEVDKIIKSEMTGTQNIKKDNTGAIQSLVVIGRGTIPKGLPSAKAKEIGRKAAERSARTEFSKFLNTSVDFKESATGEVAMMSKGEAAGEEAGNAVSAAASLDTHSEAYAAATKSAQAGLQQIGAGINDGTFVAVYGWSAADTIALIKVSKAMKDTADASVRDANTVEKSRETKATSSDSAPAASNEKAQSNSKEAAPQSSGNTSVKAPANSSSSSSSAKDFF